ncbi:MAG: glucosaminidase domain-containing protein [Acidimicrobiia bacterium]
MCRDTDVRRRRLVGALILVLGVALSGAATVPARAVIGSQDPPPDGGSSTTAPATTAPPTTAPPTTAPGTGQVPPTGPSPGSPVPFLAPPLPPPPDAKLVIKGIMDRITRDAFSAGKSLATAQLLQLQLQEKLNQLSALIAQIEGRLAELRAKVRDVDLAIVSAHNTLDSLMVGEYQRLGTAADITSVAGRSDATRRDNYGRAVTRHELAVLHQLEQQRRDLLRQVDQTTREHDGRIAEREETERRVSDAARAVDQAGATVVNVQGTLARWNTIKDGAETPIMARSELTAAELADWFKSTRRPTNATVPVEELARLFIEESSIEGVRGDIAFAQSILETGSFQFPSGGQLDGIDNNFAGIGACDSCPHGYVFPDARTGIRAQIQLLRNYADPTVTSLTLKNPPVLQNYDRFGLRGDAPRWTDLTHRWATADGYGDRILLLYVDIMKYVTHVE